MLNIARDNKLLKKSNSCERFWPLLVAFWRMKWVIGKKLYFRYFSLCLNFLIFIFEQFNEIC